MCIHQPDQALFRSVLPEDMNWEPFPASRRCRDISVSATRLHDPSLGLRQPRQKVVPR
jgi:hypothetical protein